MGRLDTRIAIVTGGGSGIGQATALRFAEEGASVMIADINITGAAETRSMIETRFGTPVTIHQTDVSQPDSVQAMVAETVRVLGTPTILVNNAGIATGDSLQLHEVDPAVWDRIQAVNLRGPFLCCKYVIPRMMAAGGGSIINIASAAAVGMAPRAAYAASKGGVVALTRSIAFQYGGKNIRCNAICPGAVETALARQARASGTYKVPIVEALIQRRAEPEEIANAVLFLASDESAFITSDVLLLDGGALRLRKEEILPD